MILLWKWPIPTNFFEFVSMEPHDGVFQNCDTRLIGGPTFVYLVRFPHDAESESFRRYSKVVKSVHSSLLAVFDDIVVLDIGFGFLVGVIRGIYDPNRILIFAKGYDGPLKVHERARAINSYMRKLLIEFACFVLKTFSVYCWVSEYP
jgi:hypothetical protein